MLTQLTFRTERLIFLWAYTNMLSWFGQSFKLSGSSGILFPVHTRSFLADVFSLPSMSISEILILGWWPYTSIFASTNSGFRNLEPQPALVFSSSWKDFCWSKIQHPALDSEIGSPVMTFRSFGSSYHDYECPQRTCWPTSVTAWAIWCPSLPVTIFCHPTCVLMVHFSPQVVNGLQVAWRCQKWKPRNNFVVYLKVVRIIYHLM
jgi:hypothetical protein